jgi:hypothetical protein
MELSSHCLAPRIVVTVFGVSLGLVVW